MAVIVDASTTSSQGAWGSAAATEASRHVARRRIMVETVAMTPSTQAGPLRATSVDRAAAKSAGFPAV